MFDTLNDLKLKKNVNYKDLDLIEHYNFGVKFIFIWGCLKHSKIHIYIFKIKFLKW